METIDGGTVSEFITNIRYHDSIVYAAVHTVVTGTILSVLLVILLSSKVYFDPKEKKEKRFFWIYVVLIVSGILVYLCATWNLRNKHYKRRNFGLNWIQNLNSQKECDQNPGQPIYSIQEYSREYLDNEEILNGKYNWRIWGGVFLSILLWLAALKFKTILMSINKNKHLQIRKLTVHEIVRKKEK